MVLVPVVEKFNLSFPSLHCSFFPSVFVSYLHSVLFFSILPCIFLLYLFQFSFSSFLMSSLPSITSLYPSFLPYCLPCVFSLSFHSCFNSFLHFIICFLSSVWSFLNFLNDFSFLHFVFSFLTCVIFCRSLSPSILPFSLFCSFLVSSFAPFILRSFLFSLISFFISSFLFSLLPFVPFLIFLLPCKMLETVIIIPCLKIFFIFWSESHFHL